MRSMYRCKCMIVRVVIAWTASFLRVVFKIDRAVGSSCQGARCSFRISVNPKLAAPKPICTRQRPNQSIECKEVYCLIQRERFLEMR